MDVNDNIYFLVNPNAKSGRGMLTWKEIRTGLKEAKLKRGRDYDVFFTECAGDASRITKILTDPDLYQGGRSRLLLFVIGGDGTLDEVINGFCLKSAEYVTIGYIPAGSGNDFARSFGALDTDQVLTLVRHPHRAEKVALDFGRMEVITPVKSIRRFVVSTGIGYDAGVCHRIHNSVTKEFFNRLKVGKIGYSVLGAIELLACKPSDGWIETDEGKMLFTNMYFTSVHIHPYEGGGYMFAPGAKADDGMLSVCMVHDLSKWKFFLFLFKMLLKDFSGLDRRYCTWINTRKIKLYTHSPRPVHCDGELMGYQKEFAAVCESGKKAINFVKPVLLEAGERGDK
ncbi:MAG: diacylglycerol kinase family lipid kinase [Lachnospiraceae bacterium]|nr:diacylglycerol kinase family lipid kinase [Lachnospiraceae bacterium]